MKKSKLIIWAIIVCIAIGAMFLILGNKTTSKNKETTGKTTSQNTPEPTPGSLLEKWGLGINKTKHVSLNRDYDWYIDQSYTGYASSNNCGPSCAVMAARWSYKDFPKSVEEARDTAPNDGGWWFISNIYDFLSNNEIPCQVNQNISESDALSYLDNGKILIVCINTKDITFNFESEQRTGKYYNRDTGHFIVLKGYMIVDGKTYFEVYDPLHSDGTYFDGTPKGKDRYYLTSEIVYSSLNWWPEYIVISEK